MNEEDLIIEKLSKIPCTSFVFKLEEINKANFDFCPFMIYLTNENYCEYYKKKCDGRCVEMTIEEKEE